jgi:hypothetical protein
MTGGSLLRLGRVLPCHTSYRKSRINRVDHGVRLPLRHTSQPLLNIQAGNRSQHRNRPVHRPLVQGNLGPQLLGAVNALIADLLQPIDERRRGFLPGKNLAGELEQRRERVFNRWGAKLGEEGTRLGLSPTPYGLRRLGGSAAAVELAVANARMLSSPASGLRARTFTLSLPRSAVGGAMTVLF